jgi:hypothetical protein
MCQVSFNSSVPSFSIFIIKQITHFKHIYMIKIHKTSHNYEFE